MTELFTPEGHLTDEALTALIEDRLDEMGRLEVGEHLSFCDACLDRYTALLTGDILEQPQQDQMLPIMRGVREKSRRQIIRRYASAAAAVAIGSALFYTGVFDSVGKTLNQRPEEMLHSEIVQPQESPRSRGMEWSNAILKAVDDWSIRVRDAAAPAYRVPVQNPETEQENQTTQMEDSDK